MDSTLPNNVKKLRPITEKEEKTKEKLEKKKWDFEHKGQLYKMKLTMKPCGLDINYLVTKNVRDMLPPPLREMMKGMEVQIFGGSGEIEESVIHVHVHHAKWQKFLHIPLSWLTKRELKRIRKRVHKLMEETSDNEAERLQKELEGDD